MSTAGDAEPALGAAEDASGQIRSDSNVMDGSASSKVTGILNLSRHMKV